MLLGLLESSDSTTLKRCLIEGVQRHILALTNHYWGPHNYNYYAVATRHYTVI